MKFIKKFNEAFYNKNANKYTPKVKLEYKDHISKWRKPGEDDTYSIKSGSDTDVAYVNDNDPKNTIIDTVANFKSNFERIQDDKVDAIIGTKPVKEEPWTPPATVEPTKQIYAEDEETEMDFEKGVYLAGEKAIIGAYLITGEDDNYVNVLNIKETGSNSAFFGDGAVPYGVSIHDFKLPKSKIKVLEPVDGKEGFSFIKLPYWLYKENPELEIRKCKVGNKKLKRLDLRDSGLNNKELMSKFKDPNVEKYLKQSNPDERTLQLVDLYKKRA